MSRELRPLDRLTAIDETHILLAQVTGSMLSLERLHNTVNSISLSTSVPQDITDQFDVARNLAVYSYFYYPFAQEMQAKLYTVIEYALRRCSGAHGRPHFKQMITDAVEQGLIKDAGFRHIQTPDPSNPYSRKLPEIIPKLRNTLAHGSNQLTPDLIWPLERAADLINQLFPETTTLNKEQNAA